MNKSNIILAIEAAIEGGSISISDGQREIDFWVGTKKVSRSEDLLNEISKLLIKNKLNKEDIKMIAVSDSIGSHTGIRIGLSTALGLSKALNCQVKSFSTPAAMALIQNKEGSFSIAVSTNNRHISFQNFLRCSEKISEVNKIQTLSPESFFQILTEESISSLIVNRSFYNFIVLNKSEILDSIKFINAGQNLAKFIGILSQNTIASDNDYTELKIKDDFEK